MSVLSVTSRCYQNRLTVKLSGRPQARDSSRGCTLSSSTRGDTADSHGPLQRFVRRHCEAKTQPNQRRFT